MIFAEIEPFTYLCTVKENRNKRFDSWWHHYQLSNKNPLNF